MRWIGVETVIVLVGWSLAGCSDEGSRGSAVPAVPLLEKLTDMDDDPDVVEVSLVAGVSEMNYLSTGPAEVWAYRDGSKEDARGRVPGPVIEAKQGDRVIRALSQRTSRGHDDPLAWHARSERI